jgi:hypothetical protein
MELQNGEGISRENLNARIKEVNGCTIDHLKLIDDAQINQEKFIKEMRDNSVVAQFEKKSFNSKPLMDSHLPLPFPLSFLVHLEESSLY